MTTKRTGFKDVGLKNFSIRRLRVLVELAQHGSRWNSDISKVLGLQTGTTAETLARMAKDGEIRRVLTPTDGPKPMFRYSLTTVGREQLYRTYRHATGKEFLPPELAGVEATARTTLAPQPTISRPCDEPGPHGVRAVT